MDKVYFQYFHFSQKINITLLFQSDSLLFFNNLNRSFQQDFQQLYFISSRILSTKLIILYHSQLWSRLLKELKKSFNLKFFSQRIDFKKNSNYQDQLEPSVYALSEQPIQYEVEEKNKMNQIHLHKMCQLYQAFFYIIYEILIIN
ncbi:unnamed protein product [Paramecium sonneborni]|uniref:Uncharacterized protein n=1 Tax=Paramecium sonneborni TaxID=65129 RepID=A0A8S1N3Z5_9CILI|nr:unnamed protein product [Paramecium sonneborni]